MYLFHVVSMVGLLSVIVASPGHPSLALLNIYIYIYIYIYKYIYIYIYIHILNNCRRQPLI